MPSITITIDDEAKKVLSKRAKKNMFTLREQIEDIIRKSAVRSLSSKKIQQIKVDDRLVSIFSRDPRGKRTMKK
jgi:hypothetical protein